MKGQPTSIVQIRKAEGQDHELLIRVNRTFVEAYGISGKLLGGISSFLVRVCI
ncbi:hypothetical protein [Effusibacillus consociatus]|uniref:GNAT family N-acetyltransferase n=1 Tax=Effusibacillus consociatus TaxID=1117041 RepID=A0ABV9PXI0_9BACL